MINPEINIYPDGSWDEIWRDKKGCFHREDGSSFIKYNKHGHILIEFFDYHGKECESFEELQRYVKHQILK